MADGMIGHVAEMALVQTRIVPGDDHETVVRSMLLTPSVGAIWYDSVDLGTPDIDEDVTPNNGTNGTYDGTRFFRSRAVTLALTVFDDWFPDYGTQSWDQAWNTSSYWTRELGRYCAPGARCWLYLRLAGPAAPVYRVDLRGAGLPSTILGTGIDREVRQLALSFKSPSGLLRQVSEDVNPARASKDGRIRTVIDYSGSGTNGVTLPITFPMTFPGLAMGVGGGIVDYTGTVPGCFIARIHAGIAPVYNPCLTFTGPEGVVQVVGFQGNNIPAGRYLEINTETKRLTLDDGTDVAPYLLGALRWPTLRDGHNKVIFTENANADASTPTAPGAGSYAEVLHFPSFFAT